jgi:hypothetical protein
VTLQLIIPFFDVSTEFAVTIPVILCVWIPSVWYFNMRVVQRTLYTFDWEPLDDDSILSKHM